MKLFETIKVIIILFSTVKFAVGKQDYSKAEKLQKTHLYITPNRLCYRQYQMYFFAPQANKKITTMHRASK